ncbi:hypothetical protein SLS55_010273 [Diplodia seriata]|uniref:Uncharacterized protein n=1 Tax=Diplodia seriata TaxID=420778 RepID=A0ABR3BY33_9PEZI
MPALPPLDADHLSLEQVETLEELGLILSPPINGKRKVSLDAFTTPPPQIPDPLPTSRPSATFHHHPSTPPHDATIDLPLAPWSVATLEFLGFTPAAAHEILAHFLDRPNPTFNCYDIIDYAESHVQGKDPRQKSLLPPRELMTQMGLNEAMQDALTDPRFAGVAGTETLQFWILDTLRVNYDALFTLQDGLRDVAIAAAAAAGEGEGGGGGGGDEDDQDDEDAEDNDDDEDDECDEDDQEDEDHEDHDDDHNAASPAAPSNTDASTSANASTTTLYAATPALPPDDFLDPRKPGGAPLHNIAQTRDGGDFNGARSWSEAWTWTPQAATAELYRAWMARRCAWTATAVVSMAVPQDLIEGLGTEEVWWRCEGEEGKREWEERFFE